MEKQLREAHKRLQNCRIAKYKGRGTDSETDQSGYESSGYEYTSASSPQTYTSYRQVYTSPPNSTPPNLPSSSQTSHTANPTPQQTQTTRSSPDRASASLSTGSRRLRGTTHRLPHGSLRDNSLQVRHMFSEGWRRHGL